MSDLRGPDEVQVDIVQDLRSHDPLITQLDDPEAVYAGHPKRPQDWPVGVVITPIYAGSDHLGAGVSRAYRIQVTILATWSWWDAEDWPELEMQRILSAIADRLDRAAAMPHHRPSGGESGANIETEDGERLALSADWRIEYAQAFK